MKHFPNGLRIAIGSLAALTVLTACSSTGGKPSATDSQMGAGQADTPRFTIAMVTHGPPGDTFWDLIRKGAETAAQKDNIDLKYSAELAAPRARRKLSMVTSKCTIARLRRSG